MGLGSRENSGDSEWLGARHCRMKDKLAEVAGVGSPEDTVPRLRQGKWQAEAMYVGEQSYQSPMTPIIQPAHFPAQPFASSQPGRNSLVQAQMLPLSSNRPDLTCPPASQE